METDRIIFLNDVRENGDGRYVLYWMQQSQRARFNPALEYAVSRANEMDRPVVAMFGLELGSHECWRDEKYGHNCRLQPLLDFFQLRTLASWEGNVGIQAARVGIVLRTFVAVLYVVWVTSAWTDFQSHSSVSFVMQGELSGEVAQALVPRPELGCAL